MRRRFSAQQWSDWFVEFERSGLSVREFCKQKGVSQNSFYQWRKKLDVDVRAGGPGATSTFVPVTVTSAESVEIELPSGAIMRVRNDAASLQPVLSVLLEIGARQP